LLIIFKGSLLYSLDSSDEEHISITVSYRITVLAIEGSVFEVGSDSKVSFIVLIVAVIFEATIGYC
jgi:hypothetical protein